MSVEMATRAAPHAATRLRVGKLARLAGLVAGVGALVGLIASFALSAVGVTPRIVISGSMEPGLPIGTIVLTERVDVAKVSVGDVVTTDRFNGPGTVTHRVVDMSHGEAEATLLTLKGDANDGVDREPYAVTDVGVLRLAIPYAGLPQLWVQDLFGIDPLG